MKMKKGKLIVFAGTDCSGKGTQSNLLEQRFKREDIPYWFGSCPFYNSPTGKDVYDYLHGGFPEGAVSLDWKVASLYFAIDRRYNLFPIIRHYINSGINVILDRYVESNMGHQASKMKTKEERLNAYKWLEHLEYDMLELPKPDITIFLYMPFNYANSLRIARGKESDQLEISREYQKNTERAYLEVASLYGFNTINCIKYSSIRNATDIHEEVYSIITKII